MTYPIVDVGVSIDVVEFTALGSNGVERIRLNVTNEVRDSCWKNSFGSFVELFRLLGSRQITLAQTLHTPSLG